MLNVMEDPIFLGLIIIVFCISIPLFIKFPMIPIIIYPFTFLDVIQSKFTITGITPAIIVGGVIIIAGIVRINARLRFYSFKKHAQFLLSLLLFPVWIFIRFLIEGSDVRIAITFLANVLAIIAIVIITSDKDRLYKLLISLSMAIFLLALSIITVSFFPSTQTYLGVYNNEIISRAVGLSRDPNYGGTMLVVGIALFGNLIFNQFEVRQSRHLLILIVITIITIYAVILTISRAAILASILILILLILSGRKLINKLILIFSGMILIALLFFYNQSLVDDISTRFSVISYDDSNFARIQIFRAGIEIIKNNFLWGIGTYKGYHNTFLDIFVYGGIVAMLAFFIPIIVISIKNLNILKKTKGNFKIFPRFYLLGITALIFNGMFIGMELEKILWFVIGIGTANIFLLEGT